MQKGIFSSSQLILQTLVYYTLGWGPKPKHNLKKWFPTAGQCKFFAGPQNIFFPHTNAMNLSITKFTLFGQFLVNKTNVSTLPCHRLSKMSAHITVIRRKTKKWLCRQDVQKNPCRNSKKTLFLRIEILICQSKRPVGQTRTRCINYIDDLGWNHSTFVQGKRWKCWKTVMFGGLAVLVTGKLVITKERRIILETSWKQIYA